MCEKKVLKDYQHVGATPTPYGTQHVGGFTRLEEVALRIYAQQIVATEFQEMSWGDAAREAKYAAGVFLSVMAND